MKLPISERERTIKLISQRAKGHYPNSCKDINAYNCGFDDALVEVVKILETEEDG